VQVVDRFHLLRSATRSHPNWPTVGWEGTASRPGGATTVCPSVGATPTPHGEWRNSAAPRGATGHQPPECSGPNGVPPRTQREQGPLAQPPWSGDERASEASSRWAGLRALSARPKTGTSGGARRLFRSRPFTRSHSAYSTDLQRRSMDRRNGGTGAGPLTGGRDGEQATGRMASAGGIAEEANAGGKAAGYADVGTVV
jgi:hypothetical protein